MTAYPPPGSTLAPSSYGSDGGDARGLTHIHSMGPIRGPEEG